MDIEVRMFDHIEFLNDIYETVLNKIHGGDENFDCRERGGCDVDEVNELNNNLEESFKDHWSQKDESEVYEGDNSEHNLEMQKEVQKLDDPVTKALTSDFLNELFSTNLANARSNIENIPIYTKYENSAHEHPNKIDDFEDREIKIADDSVAHIVVDQNHHLDISDNLIKDETVKKDQQKEHLVASEENLAANDHLIEKVVTQIDIRKPEEIQLNYARNSNAGFQNIVPSQKLSSKKELVKMTSGTYLKHIEGKIESNKVIETVTLVRANEEQQACLDKEDNNSNKSIEMVKNFEKENIATDNQPLVPTARLSNKPEMMKMNSGTFLHKQNTKFESKKAVLVVEYVRANEEELAKLDKEDKMSNNSLDHAKDFTKNNSIRQIEPAKRPSNKMTSGTFLNKVYVKADTKQGTVKEEVVVRATHQEMAELDHEDTKSNNSLDFINQKYKNLLEEGVKDGIKISYTITEDREETLNNSPGHKTPSKDLIKQKTFLKKVTLYSNKDERIVESNKVSFE